LKQEKEKKEKSKSFSHWKLVKLDDDRCIFIYSKLLALLIYYSSINEQIINFCCKQNKKESF
jgi:hypothetical protein